MCCRVSLVAQGLKNPWVWKIPWRRKWQPTPVFLPGNSRGQRSLAGYSPWGRRESDTTERPNSNSSSFLLVVIFRATFLCFCLSSFLSPFHFKWISHIHTLVLLLPWGPGWHVTGILHFSWRQVSPLCLRLTDWPWKPNKGSYQSWASDGNN